MGARSRVDDDKIDAPSFFLFKERLVIVVSEETSNISVVLGGEMLRGLDAPRLRVVLREILSGERKELPEAADAVERIEPAEGREAGRARAGRRVP